MLRYDPCYLNIRVPVKHIVLLTRLLFMNICFLLEACPNKTKNKDFVSLFESTLGGNTGADFGRIWEKVEKFT